MKTTKTILGMLIAFATVLLPGPWQIRAHAAVQRSSWSVLVDRINPGEADIEPAFQVAIYENLVDEVSKTKRFKQVFRSGDRRASEAADVLTLKTTVEKFSVGSETTRAVTTFAGATKLRVKNQLCGKDGQVLFQWEIDGNVRFLGGNLRATHTLAKNVANKLKDAKLPNTDAQGSQTSAAGTGN